MDRQQLEYKIPEVPRPHRAPRRHRGLHKRATLHARRCESPKPHFRPRPKIRPELAISVIPHDRDGEAARAYSALQRETYARHGVVRAKDTSDRCMRSCTHLILARREDGAVMGGLRIHRRLFGPLPIEAALPSSTRLAALLTELDSPVELSGTAVCQSARKTGLAHQLVRVAVAAIPVVGGRSALGFGHQHVLALYRRFGFMSDPRAGCHAYPDSRYRSSVAVLRDPSALTTVALAERRPILRLRQAIARDEIPPWRYPAMTQQTTDGVAS